MNLKIKKKLIPCFFSQNLIFFARILADKTLLNFLQKISHPDKKRFPFQNGYKINYYENRQK
jgi:hypothetical protein